MMTLLLWDILSVSHFADCIYVNLIRGKYIFRVKTNKTPKNPHWAGFFYVFLFCFVFWVFFWGLDFLMPALIVMVLLLDTNG